MSLIKKVKRSLKGCLENDSVKLRYYHLKRFLSTRGFYLPFPHLIHFSKRMWKGQGIEKYHPVPETYLRSDGSTVALFSEVLPYLKKEDRILEIGCNVGRSLKYLHDLGFRNLSGIEIGVKAIELMEKTFPEVYADSQILVGDVSEIIRGLKTADYDLVFCHSVLVSIHPKFNDVFSQMARVSRKFVLTLENEGSYTLYPRDFQRMFEQNGMKMVSSRIYIPGFAEFPVPFRREHIFRNNSIRLFVKDFSLRPVEHG